MILRFSITISPQKGSYDSVYYETVSGYLQSFITKNEIVRLVAASECGSDDQFTHFQCMLEEESSQTAKERREIWRQRLKYTCQKLPGYSKHTIKVVDRTATPDSMGYPLKEVEDLTREQVMLHSVTEAEAEELRESCPLEMKEGRGRPKFQPFPYLNEVFKYHIEEFENAMPQDLRINMQKFRVYVAQAVAHGRIPQQVMSYCRTYPDVVLARFEMMVEATRKMRRIIVGNETLMALKDFEVCLGEQTEKKRKFLTGEEVSQYCSNMEEAWSEEKRRRSEMDRVVTTKHHAGVTGNGRKVAGGTFITHSQIERPAMTMKVVNDFDFLDE